MSIKVPPELTCLLLDFTVAVLRQRPADVYEFAAEFFTNAHKVHDQKSSPKKSSVGGDSDSDDSDSSVRERMTKFIEPDIMEEPEGFTRRKFIRRSSVAAEKYDPELDDDDHVDEASANSRIFPKTDEQRKRLTAVCKPILLFRSLDEEKMLQVIDSMFERQVVAGDHIITEGEDGDNFYIIDHGTYDIFVGGKKVLEYKDEGSFGELALMYNQPRAATIIATTSGVVWAMSRAEFRRIVLKDAFNRRKMYESLIEGVPLLSSLTHYERMNVADALFTRTYNENDCIIRQGEEANCMYFIMSGTVRIAIRPSPDQPELELKKVYEKEFFGELALVTHKPRAASAYADGGPLKVAVLDVSAFERLMGPCLDIMKRNITGYASEAHQAIQESKMSLNMRY